MQFRLYNSQTTKVHPSIKRYGRAEGINQSMNAPALPLLVAFYLPQYHPIPENDEWWGKGFTEWTNVNKARPQFRGHYQPHVPSQLGQYDLRDPSVIQRQADLAAESGISAFAYYHYWFNGRRLLERPVDELLARGTPDFPFLLIWANENWTRRWDGGNSEILMEQHYSPEDDLDHFRAMRSALTDEKYLLHDGRPIIGIYRISKLPEPRATTDIWRTEAERWGLPGIYLLSIESFGDTVGDPRPLGFDAAVEFQPSWADLPKMPKLYQLRRKLRHFNSRYSPKIFRYEDLARHAMERAQPNYPRWPGVTPGFDNTARRRSDATIMIGSSPDRYQEWLEVAISRSVEVSARFENGIEGLLFINAWNEWGEGNHLEPDQLHGSEFLKATRSAIDNIVREL
jgi:lipopolysaccharide biosynthesis protein